MEAYAEYRMVRCSENKCSASIPNGFTAYCGEGLQRSMSPGKTDVQKMCDCIIFSPREDKISAVELKNRKRASSGGQKKAGSIDDVRAQLAGGLLVLCKMLEVLKRPNTHIQLVLYTKSEISDYSELKELSRPLDRFPDKLRIANVACGSPLPDGYVRMCVKDMRA